jgi:putative intracellular protease/amidase
MLKETNQTMPDESVSILLFPAKGFEDPEAAAIRDVFGWTQYRKNLKKAIVSTTGFHPIIKSRFGLKVEPDLPFSEANPKDCQALVLPGGFYSDGFDEAFDEKLQNPNDSPIELCINVKMQRR